jgi:hypothetical protein
MVASTVVLMGIQSAAWTEDRSVVQLAAPWVVRTAFDSVVSTVDWLAGHSVDKLVDWRAARTGDDLAVRMGDASVDLLVVAMVGKTGGHWADV